MRISPARFRQTCAPTFTHTSLRVQGSTTTSASHAGCMTRAAETTRLVNVCTPSCFPHSSLSQCALFSCTCGTTAADVCWRTSSTHYSHCASASSACSPHFHFRLAQRLAPAEYRAKRAPAEKPQTRKRHTHTADAHLPEDSFVDRCGFTRNAEVGTKLTREILPFFATRSNVHPTLRHTSHVQAHRASSSYIMARKGFLPSALELLAISSTTHLCSMADEKDICSRICAAKA